jgi:predicted permease
MHNHTMLKFNNIENNLYPALFQVFIIIFCGYFSNYFQIITESQAYGLNKFVSSFSLPSLIFYSLCKTKFELINWNYILGIFLSKTCVFILIFIACLLTIRPLNFGIAAILSIFVSQSNDFALGYPIIKALYQVSNPDYLHYIYLISPISLCFLNPIGFFMLEINEKLTNERTRNFKAINLIASVLWGTISNPIVFMTGIGILVNFLLNGNIPWLIEPFVKTLGDSFSALALFYLGYLMVNRIKQLSFNKILIIIILVFVKSLVFPIISRELVFHVENFNRNSETSTDDVNSLSTYAFLYGTLPSAPSIYFYITKYNLICDDIISPGLIFGTFISIPFMVISAKMITFDFNHQNSTQFEIGSSNSTDIFYFDKEKHFENITCKISLLASFLTLASLTWIIYLFISKSYCRLKPHLYTFILINVQLLLSIIEIIWNYMSISSNNYIKFYRIYFTSQMLLTLITRCLSITIILSILQILNVTERLGSENFQTIKKIYAKLINSVVLKYIIAFILPLIATFLFILLENFNQDKENNIMIIRFNSKQTYVYLILLSLIIILNLYCLFTYTRYDHYFVNKRNESDINDETDNAEDPLISNSDSVVSTEQFHIREPLVDNDYSLDGKY